MQITDKTVKEGFVWSFIGRAGNQCISFIVFAILTRLLSADDFGILALTMVFVELSIIVSNFGWETTIIQQKNIDIEDLSAIITFATCIALLLASTLYVFSDIIAGLIGVIEVAEAIKVLCVLVIISPLHISINAVFKKRLDLKTVSIRDLLASSISGSIAIIMAFNGYGYFSLVIYYLLVRLVSIVLVYPKLLEKPEFNINLSTIRRYSKFSIYVFLSNLIKYGKSRIIDLIIHYSFGLRDLGLFSIGMKLIEFISKLTQQIITSVMFPYFSKVQEDKRLIHKGIIAINAVCYWLIFPISFFVFVYAQELIIITIGEKYLPAFMILRLGSLLLIIRFILGNYNAILTALGKVKMLSFYNALNFIFIIVLLLIIKKFGIDYVILSYVFGNFLLLVVLMKYLSNVTNFIWTKNMSNFGAAILFNLILSGIFIIIQQFTSSTYIKLFIGISALTTSLYFISKKYILLNIRS